MDPHPETPRILEWLASRTPEMIELLEELTRLESPSTVPETQGPVFQVMARELEELEFRVRRRRSEGNGGQRCARPKRRVRGRPMQVVIGHVDTVWPVGTLELMPIVKEGERIRGPGVFDMKGGLVQSIFALRAIRELDLEPRVTPTVFLNSDEEIGSPESENRVRHIARRAARALVLEPALEPVGKLKTSRRGGGQFEIRVRGLSAHTGLAPGEGASAIHELSHLVQKLYTLSDPERGVTVNVGEIRGGTRPNVVAAEASAVVDVRVRTSEDGRWLEEQIRELATGIRVTPGTAVEVLGGVDRPPMEPTPGNRTLWAASRAVGRRLGLELDEGMSGGGSDGNTTSLFAPTLDGLGAVGDGAHAVHEYLDVARMPERAALLAGILLLPDLRAGPEPPEGVGHGL
jgi:glutamate carboxypeptidase